MSLKSKLINITFLLALVALCGARVVAYEIQKSPGFDPKLDFNNGKVDDLFKNTQPSVDKIIRGLSGTGGTSTGVSVDSFFNFKKFSANDIGSVIKSIFGLVFKVLAVMVTVSIDALKGIIGAVQK